MEIIKKSTNKLVKFQALVVRKADKLLWDIPAKADKGGDEKEVVITFLIMPRDTQGSDTDTQKEETQDFVLCTCLRKSNIMRCWNRGAQGTPDTQMHARKDKAQGV